MAQSTGLLYTKSPMVTALHRHEGVDALENALLKGKPSCSELHCTTAPRSGKQRLG